MHRAGPLRTLWRDGRLLADAVHGGEELLKVVGEGSGEFLPREELEARGEGGGVDGGEDVADELITGGVSGWVRHAKLDKLQWPIQSMCPNSRWSRT